jgi:hypothetical protein
VRGLSPRYWRGRGASLRRLPASTAESKGAGGSGSRREPGTGNACYDGDASGARWNPGNGAPHAPEGLRMAEKRNQATRTTAILHHQGGLPAHIGTGQGYHWKEEAGEFRLCSKCGRLIGYAQGPRCEECHAPYKARAKEQRKVRRARRGDGWERPASVGSWPAPPRPGNPSPSNTPTPPGMEPVGTGQPGIFRRQQRSEPARLHSIPGLT